VSKRRWKRGRRWWLPPLAILIPGSCYALAAYAPYFEPVFAALGVFFTALTVILLYVRVFQSSYVASPRMQWVVIQLVTLSGLLIGLRYWMALLQSYSVLVVAIVIAIYILAWLLPYVAPVLAIRFFHEVWYPKTFIGKAIVSVAAGLGGGGAAWIGLHLRGWLGLSGAWIVVATISSLASILAGAYFSTAAWR